MINTMGKNRWVVDLLNRVVRDCVSEQVVSGQILTREKWVKFVNIQSNHHPSRQKSPHHKPD